MKNLQKLIALLLCAVLVFSLAACDTKPTADDPSGESSSTAQSTAPTETVPAQSEEKNLYNDARAIIENAQDLTLRISLEKAITVADETLSETADQTVIYSGIGTDAVKVRLDEHISYGSYFSGDYEEVFIDGNVYLLAEDAYRFCASMKADAYLQRLIPSVLLDADLYGSITSNIGDKYTTLAFSEPSSGENWALPDSAELIEASGSAMINSDGAIHRSCYCVTYTYGSAQIALNAEVYVTLGSESVQIPEDADTYTPVQQIDTVRLSTQAAGYLLQANAVSASSLESLYCQAAGVLRNESLGIDLLNGEKMTKITDSIYFMDYSINQSDSYEQEEVFYDGKYSFSENGGDPEISHNVTWSMFQNFFDTQLLSHLIAFDYWEDAAVEDLGSTYLISCTFNEDLGESISDNIGILLFEDADLLDDLASSYCTTEVSGYFAIDKYTGLPTAAGYNYTGQHTIDGYPYLLSFQSDMCIEAPALGVYKAITDEMPEEAEPENKATPLFYHVTGDDGQEMWLLGTIHIGDERTAYLPQEIYDAFDASDALALEFDSEAFNDRLEEDDEFQSKISDYYYYSDGSSIKDHLDSELYEAAVKLLKASGNYNMNADYLKPYFWSSSIDNFHVRQGYTLNGDQGVEERLTERAHVQDKEILDVESGEFQVSMLSGYSDALQETLLAESVSTDAMAYWQSTAELLDMWCAGDEQAMREHLTDAPEELAQMTEEERKLYAEYNNAMLLYRNRDMLDVAISYLESGKTVFFAVGLAHLLVEEGLVDTLRDAGYTVELVTYSE